MDIDINKKAFALIDTFAKALLELNGGKKIPSTWAIRLETGLQRTSKTNPGVKRDPEETRAIVKRLTLNRKSIEAPRTKHHSPAEAKNRIATELSISRKKVDRTKTENESLESLALEIRKPHIDGMGDAIMENILSGLDTEDREEQALLLRKRKYSKRNDETE